MLSRFSRMLIVDDDTSSRRSTHRALVSLGYDNIEGCSNSEARRRVERFLYRIVLADWSLQTFQGLDFLKLMRTESQNKATPVIFAIPPAQKKFIEVARDDGTTYYLPKPFTKDALADRLTQINLRLAATHPAVAVALGGPLSEPTLIPGGPRSLLRAL